MQVNSPATSKTRSCRSQDFAQVCPGTVSGEKSRRPQPPDKPDSEPPMVSGPLLWPRWDGFSSGPPRETHEEVLPCWPAADEPPLLWAKEPALPGSWASVAFLRPRPRHLQPFPSGPAGRPWPVCGLSPGARPAAGAQPGPTPRSASPPVVPGRPRAHRPAWSRGARVMLPRASLAGRSARPTWKDLRRPEPSEAELKRGVSSPSPAFPGQAATGPCLFSLSVSHTRTYTLLG